jgi:hypothetical protein
MLHVAYVVKQTTMHARMTVSLSSEQQLHSNWRSHLLHEWKQAGVPRMPAQSVARKATTLTRTIVKQQQQNQPSLLRGGSKHVAHVGNVATMYAHITST